MRIWIDAQLPPSLALWLKDQFGVDATPVRDLRLQDASDLKIFEAAQQHNAIVMTKDADFLDLIRDRGTPPQIIWITCGNTSNANLRRILLATFADALQLLQAGETIVEIRES